MSASLSSTMEQGGGPGAGRVVRSVMVAIMAFACVASSGCATRHKLDEVDLQDAMDSAMLTHLRVFPSSRMISVYDEPKLTTVTISREIRQRSHARRRKRILSRETAGAIVGEDVLNGQRWLWVTFDRQCVVPECAYGFVEAEDARYLLAHVPQREGFADPRIYRGCRLERHRLQRGHLRALTEANQVYRLRRKRRAPVVFLEVKGAKHDRVEERAERESGV
ncbi:MAG: hypothetical protein K0V04_25400 [Deltaproteobacteria bacterium]|nr:hypothetical protein [Deltaproteobacteria bacterium]